MEYELIKPDEIVALAGLPPEEAFVIFESKCRARLHVYARNLDHNDSGNDLYLEYMGLVAAAAEEYQISGHESLDIPSVNDYVFGDYRTFTQLILKIVTRLQIRSSRGAQQTSVTLEPADREQILHHIRQLRDRILDSTLDGGQKKALLKKLDLLETELANTKLGLAKTMVILTAFFAAINQAESAIIKAPDAIIAIMRVIGIAKGLEEEQKLALSKPEDRLAIEDQRSEKVATSQQEDTTVLSDTDSDIPF